MSYLRVVIICSLFSLVVSQVCTGARFLDPLPPPSYSDVLFPLPSSYSFGNDVYYVDQRSFSFVSSSSSAILAQAFTRYIALIFGNSISVSPSYLLDPTYTLAHPGFSVLHENTQHSRNAEASPTLLWNVTVVVRSANETLQYGIDESYDLNVTAPQAVLMATTVYGALRGLETFAQLVTANASYSGLTISGAPWIIHDTPRYSHRGVLIDTSRHFLNISTIQRTIDSLSYSKMNVLHWHLTDAQSFPFLSQAYPNLANGRFSAKEVYSTTDLQNIVQYAKLRGVRVMVELDTPGHVASWGVGFPQITVCRDKTRQQGYCAENPCGQLDPSQPLTFQVVQGLVEELTQIFPDNFFHFGADEFVYECWNTSSIVSWMQQQQLASFKDVLDFYEQTVHGIGAKYGRTPVNSQEIFDANITLPDNIIIQVWKDFTTLGAVVKAGHRAILSNYNAWYLDCGFANWCPYCSWLDAYNNEPLTGNNFTIAQQALILGGETCIWGEQVTDRNLDSRVWPRAAAVAERLWSPQNVTNVADAFTRLLKHTCRLAARGIDTDALSPGSNPYSCVNIQE